MMLSPAPSPRADHVDRAAKSYERHTKTHGHPHKQKDKHDHEGDEGNGY
jgi:uncharacterized C2H2 Zn-finger protein